MCALEGRNQRREEDGRVSYFLPSIISFIASIRSDSFSPGAKNGSSNWSTVVGEAWPQIRQSCSSPNHISFWRTMYSVQTCCFAGSGAGGGARLVDDGSVAFLVDCRLAIRSTTWRIPELGISGICVARSATTRIPVKNVAGARI